MALLICTYLDLIFNYIDDNNALKIIEETSLYNFFKYEFKESVGIAFYIYHNNKYRIRRITDIRTPAEVNDIRQGVREIKFRGSY